MSIQTEIDRITANIAESYSVASDKGATLPEEQNSDNLAETLRSITVGGAVVEPEEKDVNFYDYDGTRLYSYTLAEAQALTELPPLPTQPGLICQEWNWTLDEIQALGREIDVGALYVTDNGKTRIYITVGEFYRTPQIGICVNGIATIDWGDGSQLSTLTGNSIYALVYSEKHTYNSNGDYVITIDCDDMYGFGGLNNESKLLCDMGDEHACIAYRNMITKIEMGSRARTICNYAFGSLWFLQVITINPIISVFQSATFNECTSLETVIIPKKITEVSPSSFANCSVLGKVVLHNNIKTIAAQSFLGTRYLKTLLSGNNVTNIGTQAFNNARKIKKIPLSDKLNVLGPGAFQYCGSIERFVVPPTINNIDSNAFYGCCSCRIYDFGRHTAIPVLVNTNAFYDMNNKCEIRVPAALYDEWIAATNWSTYADHIVAV